MNLKSMMLLFLHCGLLLAGGADWPEWRGPHRDGSAAGRQWPENLQHLEMQWQVKLGKSYSSPLITADRVFVFETTDDSTVTLRALRRDSGVQIWSTAWASSGSVPGFASSNGDWVRSTPAWDGEIVYVGDMQERLVALRGSDGGEVWRIDFPHRCATPVPDFGFSSSPLVTGQHLYVQAANSLIKLDKASGATIWQALQDQDELADMTARGAFSSPVIATLAGREQVIAMTRRTLNGVDPLSGEKLWSVAVPHFSGCLILTPAVYGDAIFISSYREGSWLYGISEREGLYSAEILWQNTAAGYMSSPVIINDHAYLHLGNGRLECINLNSGETAWRSTESFGKYSSMIWQEDKILLLTGDGRLNLLRANTLKPEILDSREVAPEKDSWAYPGISGEDLFVRALEGLMAYRWNTATP